MKPMLAESIKNVPKTLPQLISDDTVGFEQKVDGHRVLISITDAGLAVLDRKGEPKKNAIPPQIVAAFAGIGGGPWVFDGELVGNTLWLFDMPVAGEFVTPGNEYRYRRELLTQIIQGWAPPACIQALPVFWTADEKGDAAIELLRRGAEGLMVKTFDAPYQPGVRSRFCRKAKYTHDVDVIAGDPKTGLVNREGKDNIVLTVFDETGERVEIGVCTALAGDGADVAYGDVITVNYLYATPGERRLYQPTLPRLRDDKTPDECTIDQLVFCDKTVITDLASAVAV